MRRVTIIGLIADSLLYLGVIGIHVYEQIYRYPVGHVLATLKTFHVEETSTKAVFSLRDDYHSYVTDRGTCSEDHCEFSVTLTQWESLIRLTGSYPRTERPTYYLVRGLRFFGLRVNYFMATVVVKDGKLRGVFVGLRPMCYIEYGNPGEHGFLSNIGIGAGTVGNFRRWFGTARIYEHPNLLVWKPSACTGCSGAINADFTWQASRDEYQRALDFNLPCITRFNDCRTREEYLPRAAEILKDDRAENLSEKQIALRCLDSTDSRP
jgi:hypothetical protein